MRPTPATIGAVRFVDAAPAHVAAGLTHPQRLPRLHRASHLPVAEPVRISRHADHLRAKRRAPEWLPAAGLIAAWTLGTAAAWGLAALALIRLTGIAGSAETVGGEAHLALAVAAIGSQAGLALGAMAAILRHESPARRSRTSAHPPHRLTEGRHHRILGALYC